MSLGRRRWNVSDSYAKTWQHFRSANVSLESSIRGLFGDIFTFKIKVGFMRNQQNVTLAWRQTEHTQQSCGRNNMHIHEWTSRRTAHRARPELRFGYACWPATARPVGDIRSDAALFPNYFGQTCYTLLQFCSKLKSVNIIIKSCTYMLLLV